MGAACGWVGLGIGLFSTLYLNEPFDNYAFAIMAGIVFAPINTLFASLCWGDAYGRKL